MSTVLITGANRGLGLEFVRQYIAGNWQVIACCRAPEKAADLQDLAKSSPSLTIETLESADPKSIRALAAKLADTPIDLLINNAGIYSGAQGSLGKDASQEFGSIDADAWAKVLAVNTIAPIMVAQSFAPHLQRGRDKKIINITSKMGSLSAMGAGSVAYRSSKTALNGAMRVIAHDLKKIDVAIYNLHPGWVQTDMGGKSADLSPQKSVSAMREAISHLTAAQSGSFLNYDGQTLPW